MTKANAQAGTYEGSRVTGEMFLQKIGERRCVKGRGGYTSPAGVVLIGIKWGVKSKRGQCALAKTRPCLPHSPDPEGAPFLHCGDRTYLQRLVDYCMPARLNSTNSHHTMRAQRVVLRLSPCIGLPLHDTARCKQDITNASRAARSPARSHSGAQPHPAPGVLPGAAL